MTTEQKSTTTTTKPRYKLKADVRDARPARNNIEVGERVTIGRRDYEVTHIHQETNMVTLVSLEGAPMQIQLTRRYLEEN